jgi:shikimate dehydrogenase
MTSDSVVACGMISGKTRLLALIGHFVYVCLDVVPDDLPTAVEGAAALNLRGFNITMPHKRAMIPLLDELDEGARISGAVNTVVIEDSTLRGYNTDGSGMVMACREAGVELAGKRVLLLGAGGAAAAIALALSAEGSGELRVVNRSLEHAVELRDKLCGSGLKNVEVYARDALDEATLDAEVIVNATPLGMKDGDPLPIPAEHLNEGMAVCDAVYRPDRETSLVREARERGTRAVTGERMLLYQGVQAQRLWTGREPNVKAMDDAIS